MKSKEHIAIELWQRQHPARYPAGVLPISKAIPGLAFFPGGYGLWGAEGGVDLPPFPRGGVMILGHDFHSEYGYNASVIRGRESKAQPTWLNLLKLLRGADIRLEKCFFTNFYMGVRQGAATTGVFPGSADRKFVKHCSDFFLVQLEAMRPSLILTLGKHVPPLIASRSSHLAAWRGAKNFRQIDDAGPVHNQCRFDGVPNFAVAVVALTHPSMRNASVMRRYGTSLGSGDPEVALLKSVTAAMSPSQREALTATVTTAERGG
jgi:uracil-DNA glycosylase